ncbi:hypothetical protein EYC84_003074 [Monilinia fructicola]|uniref:gamma-glutamylcyclotransferase n=1 Tax=Monilinia fructicola TaxID=38448 RepID=A0A5M9JSI6_MONFR|nr:hypothetical protein EYC84_003074 [Monilinia fructicola]
MSSLSSPASGPETPTLYFAYGSNLSLTQMKARCPNSTYYGLGVLQGYRWIINQRGYANIVSDPPHDPGPAPPHPSGPISPGNAADDDGKTASDTGIRIDRSGKRAREKAKGGDVKTEAKSERRKEKDPENPPPNKVYGLLYTLTPADESALDRNEGVPFAYTKIYLPITLLSTLPSPLPSSSSSSSSSPSSSSASSSCSSSAASPSPPASLPPTRLPSQSFSISGLSSRLSALIFSPSGMEHGAKPQVRALTYIDLHRTAPSTPNPEYIHRMNRGIQDAISKGMDMSYVRDVMRLYIPEVGEESRDQLRDGVGGEKKGGR